MYDKITYYCDQCGARLPLPPHSGAHNCPGRSIAPRVAIPGDIMPKGFEPGDRVCIPMTGTAGTILTITGDRARVQYDHGPIGEPKLFILTAGELP